MKIKISGLPPYNGEHQVEPPFNAREWNIFKTTGGVLPTTLGDAIAGGDVSVVVALVIIALKRKGEVVNEAMIWDNYYPGEESATGARIEVVFDEEPADAVPPPSPSSEPEPRQSSGMSGNGDGDSHQENDQSFTGLVR